MSLPEARVSVMREAEYVEVRNGRESRELLKVELRELMKRLGIWSPTYYRSLQKREWYRAIRREVGLSPSEQPFEEHELARIEEEIQHGN